MTPLTLLSLYIAFRLKQFLCDFVFQTNWMAMTKGMPGPEGYKALASHVAFHGVGTTLVALIFAPSLWWLGLVDVVIHGGIDRIKGLMTYKKGWDYEKKCFWCAFGLDQELHNYTHLGYIVLIVLYLGGIKI
ncbi:MAG: DUF3307 domain-containing protein [Rhodospirillales bacterium]|nr:DUF3307 domain-containing protein [Rhodospirillales bacterium]MCB9996652.1 DUF3307 domain-containing protein [Rhodospirillales bacterium]